MDEESKKWVIIGGSGGRTSLMQLIALLKAGHTVDYTEEFDVKGRIDAQLMSRVRAEIDKVQSRIDDAYDRGHTYGLDSLYKKMEELTDQLLKLKGECDK